MMWWLLVGLFAYTNAICENYNFDKNFENSTSLFCSPFVSSQVFISNTTNQTSLNYALSNDPSFLLLLKMQSILPLDCFHTSLSILCQSYFPSCSQSSSPSYPCLSMCQSAVTECGNIWGKVNATSPFDCAKQPNGERWPTSDCSTATGSDYFSLPAVSTCPSIYAFKKRPKSNEAPCALRCPDPGYPEEDFYKVAEVTTFGSLLSIFLLAFLVFSYLIDFKRRMFPARLQIYLFIAAAGFTIGPAITGTKPIPAMCADSTTYATQDNSTQCAGQTFFFIYFAYGAFLWVFMIALATSYAIVFEVSASTYANKEKYMHAFIWIGSLVPVIVAYSIKAIDYGSVIYVHCFAQIDYEASISPDNAIIYIPNLVINAATTVLFVASMSKLVKYQFQKSIYGDMSKTIISAQRRIFIITAALVIIYGVIYLQHSLGTDAEGPERLKQKQIWYNCKIKAELFDTPYPPECNTQYNPERVTFSNILLTNFWITMFGVIVFLTFGTDRSIYQNWKFVFTCIKDKDFTKLRGCVMHGYSDLTPVQNSPHTSNTSNTV